MKRVTRILFALLVILALFALLVVLVYLGSEAAR